VGQRDTFLAVRSAPPPALTGGPRPPQEWCAAVDRRRKRVPEQLAADDTARPDRACGICYGARSDFYKEVPQAELRGCSDVVSEAFIADHCEAQRRPEPYRCWLGAPGDEAHGQLLGPAPSRGG
jgi:hypothetical protein